MLKRNKKEIKNMSARLFSKVIQHDALSQKTFCNFKCQPKNQLQRFSQAIKNNINYQNKRIN